MIIAYLALEVVSRYPRQTISFCDVASCVLCREAPYRPRALKVP